MPRASCKRPRESSRWLRILTFFVLLLSGGFSPVAAHGGAGLGPPLETRLQLPPWVVWITGALVVALSYAVVAGFATRSYAPSTRAVEPNSSNDALPRMGKRFLRALGLLGLFLLLAQVFLPNTNALFVDTWVWLVAWSTLPVLTYLFGNVWALLNPFQTLAVLTEKIRGNRTPLTYPSHLGTWPSVAMLLLLVGLEVTPRLGHEVPFLPRLVLFYTLFTLLGMTLFGERLWLKRIEVFTRFFHWWSAFAPFPIFEGKTQWEFPTRRLQRLHFSGSGDVAFTVALLWGVNYDGFLATRIGQTTQPFLESWTNDTVASLFLLFGGFGLFLAAYWTCVAFIRRVSETLDPLPAVAIRFAPSLLPIAVAYHLAHNFFYAMENFPRIVTSLQDPLGQGWNPIASWDLPLTIPVPDSYYPYLGGLQMSLIVAGHILAVAASHRLAFDGFPSRIQAIRSEFPLALIMVFYTLVGLWILTQSLPRPTLGGGT